MAAHFLRAGQGSLVALPFAALSLLILQRRWATRAVQAMLLVAAVYWLLVLGDLAGQRQEMGLPWGRLAGILVAVSLGTLGAAWALDGWHLWCARRQSALGDRDTGDDRDTADRSDTGDGTDTAGDHDSGDERDAKGDRDALGHGSGPARGDTPARCDTPARGDKPARGDGAVGSPLAAFLLTAGALSLVQVMVQRPMLLPERFVPHGGWWAVVGLAAWAGWLTHRLGDPKGHPRWRARAWGIFSLVFFAQLAIGLAGVERMLMTGALHVPVPAVILGGPLYRGEGVFMITLFGATLLLVGPAWCSWLCYIGAWDNSLARRRSLAQAPPGRWLPWLRVGTLVGTVGVALGLRWAGVGGTWAAAAALVFGGLGVGIMALYSRQSGTLVHCTYYCPLGLVAVVLGRISPHRLRIGEACTDCGLCTRACRYGALSPRDVARRRPGLSCTLCGDCIPSCRQGALSHRFPGLGPESSRVLLLVLVVSLHAMTLGLARL